MTFHIPSMVKQFGFADAGTSETVLITDDGGEPLTEFDPGLFVSQD